MSSVEGIKYMDAALYKAAASGDVQVFNGYRGFELKSLRTPFNNTVLHVYLASLDGNSKILEFHGFSGFDHVPQYVSTNRRLLRTVVRILQSDPLMNEFFNRTRSVKFIEQTSTGFMQLILDKCPTMLLQANNNGQTPLHVAARYGPYTVMKFLIEFQERQVDVEQEGTAESTVRRMLRNTDLELNTPLHIAAQYSCPEVVKELLKFEDPHFPYCINRKQESPLYIAARRGDKPLLRIILENLNSVAHDGPHGRTALHAAAMSGDAGATRIIIEKRQNLTKERDEDGHTPLHYAAHLGHSSVVKELLKWDITTAYVTDKKWEMTPLLMAARQGHGHIVTKFLSVCPDCCAKADKNGWNLLHFWAVRNYPSELSNHIFECDGDISRCGAIGDLMKAEDTFGITPQQVYDASRKNYKHNKKMEQIVKLLGDIVNEEVAEAPVRPIDHVSIGSFEKAREAHLVVATLIATVTFAAAITVPGGYKSEKGSDQGTPFLIHDAAFKAFVIADALAFIFSLSAVTIYFNTMPPFVSSLHNLPALELAANFLYLALVTTMVAFSTGTYVILKPSPGLAIASCCIGLSLVFILGLRDSLNLIAS